MNKIGDRIKKYRLKSNYTQEELGNMLFVSDKTVSSWEKSRTYPDLETINNISKVLNCSLSCLLYDDVEKGNIETEIKVRLSEFEYNNLLKKISNNSKLLCDVKQIDYYYELPELKKNEWLRIRNFNNRNLLTYKRWYQNKYCDEYEVYIDNKDNLSKILELMGSKLLVTVEKKRIQYLYNGKYEISFDNVKDLGLFVEIEVIDYDTTPSEEYDNLIELAGELKLNLNNISNKRYPEYFL